jgi:hypothetical protein
MGLEPNDVGGTGKCRGEVMGRQCPWLYTTGSPPNDWFGEHSMFCRGVVGLAINAPLCLMSFCLKIVVLSGLEAILLGEFIAENCRKFLAR